MYLYENNLYGFAFSKFVAKTGFKLIDTKNLDVNKYTSNSSEGCVLKVDLEQSKELRQSHK